MERITHTRASVLLGLVLFVTVSISCSSCASYPWARQQEEPPLTGENMLKQWQGMSEMPVGRPQGPLTLDRAIEEALKASPELDLIRQRIDGATEQVRQAEASFYPRLILGEDFNVTDNPVYALMNIKNRFWTRVMEREK